MYLSYSIRLLAVALLLAGCRNEKVAFQFRPPTSVPQPRRPQPARPDTLTTPSTTVALPTTQSHHTQSNSKAARHTLFRPPLTQPRKLVAKVSRPLTRYLKRPLREQATAQKLPKAVRVGLLLIGIAALIMLLIILAAPSIATFEGILLAYVGYLLAIGLAIAGVIAVVLGLVLIKS